MNTREIKAYLRRQCANAEIQGDPSFFTVTGDHHEVTLSLENLVLSKYQELVQLIQWGGRLRITGGSLEDQRYWRLKVSALEPTPEHPDDIPPDD